MMIHSGKLVRRPALTPSKRGEPRLPAPPYSTFSISRKSSFVRCGVLGERGDGEDLDARVLHLAPDLYARTLLPADARPDRQYRSDRRKRARPQWSPDSRCGSGHQQDSHTRRAQRYHRCRGKFLGSIPATWKLLSQGCTPGFKPLVLNDVQVQITEVRRLKIQLAISGAKEQTTVSVKPLSCRPRMQLLDE